MYVASEDDGLIILNKFAELRFGPASVRTDRLIRLPLAGPSGQRIRIERSANLIDWEEWQTAVIGDDDGCEITDSTTQAPRRFYRAIEDH